VTALLSIQVGTALSVGLVDAVGVAGTSWLRLSAGALILLVIVKPSIRTIDRRDMPAILGLGIATALMTTCVLAAVEHIPLGTTVAIGFLGPLMVAAVPSTSKTALAWPGLALVGVVMITEPWSGQLHLVGILFAAASGAAWSVYIILTQLLGGRLSGVTTLSLTVPIAATCVPLFGMHEAVTTVSVGGIAVAVGLAVLNPVLPLSLELLALRRMSQSAFGTLMAVEPAMGAVIGLVFLYQIPGPFQVVGILAVVLAGTLAQRPGRPPADHSAATPNYVTIQGES
jgi:inner membrane transporter RhtA